MLMDMSLCAVVLSSAVGIALALYIFVKYKIPWILLDLKYIVALAKLKKLVDGFVAKKWTILDVFEEKTRLHPNKTFLLFEDEKYTYGEMNAMFNKVGHFGLECGLKPGDVVAIMIYNDPLFIATYFGLMKIGVHVAFLNTNLRLKSLHHCFSESNAKMLIVGRGDDLLQAIQDIASDVLAADVQVYVQGHGDKTLDEGFMSFDALYNNAPSNNINAKIRAGTQLQDTSCLIYTSGTTGLPKAAVITHLRVYKMSGLPKVFRAQPNDVLYTGLPLYHGVGICAVGGVILIGATLALSRRFSASRFWDDCRKHRATVIQYIGETCRYLLAQPQRGNDKDNEVMLAFGNGLRIDVWKEFQERFDIKTIGEFYGATEGNIGLLNMDNKLGAVGRLSPFIGLLYPVAFIKYNFDLDEPVRDSNGFCIRIKAGETGLMIGKIKKDLEFDGYLGNPRMTQKKILVDIFKKGDKYFNSGDLMSRDELYYIYFKDRIGDTFRWKGENVSTIEVSNVISDLDCVEDANVYGVSVPGHDGRAGMAAITLKGNGNPTERILQSIYTVCQELLPAYARPRFLRFINEMTITPTFKQKKIVCVKEGFDPTVIQDPVYFMDSGKEKYIPVDADIYDKIIKNKFRI